MIINFQDPLGYIQVTVNEYGFTFDSAAAVVIFEDETGKEYRIPVSSICSITEG